MICDEAQLELSAYLDNEVPAQERGALEAHIKECPVCQAVLADLSSVKSSLSDLPKLKAPATLADSIRREAKNPASEAPAANVILFPSAPRRSMWAPAVMGIAALLVAGLMIFVLLPLVSQRNPSQVAVNEERREPAAAAPAVNSEPALKKQKELAGESAPAESREASEKLYKAEQPAERKSSVDALETKNSLRQSESLKALQEKAPQPDSRVMPAKEKAKGADAPASPDPAAARRYTDAKDSPVAQSQAQGQDALANNDKELASREAPKPFKDEALSGALPPKPAAAAPGNNRTMKKVESKSDDAGGKEQDQSQDRVAHNAAPAAKAPRQDQASNPGPGYVGGDGSPTGSTKDGKDKVAGTRPAPVAPPAPATATAAPAAPFAPSSPPAAAPAPTPTVGATKAAAPAEGKKTSEEANDSDSANAKDAGPADKARFAKKPSPDLSLDQQKTWSNAKRDAAADENRQRALADDSKSANLDAAEAQQGKAGKAEPSRGFGGGAGQGGRNNNGVNALAQNEQADTTVLALSVQRPDENMIVCKTRNPARLIRELKRLSDARHAQFGLGDVAALPSEELARKSQLRTQSTEKEAASKPADESNGGPAAPATKAGKSEAVVYKISIAAGERQALLAGIQNFAATETAEMGAAKEANKHDDKLKTSSAQPDVEKQAELRHEQDAKDDKVPADKKEARQKAEPKPAAEPDGEETVIYVQVITVP